MKIIDVRWGVEMKKQSLAVLMALFLAAPVLADKPEWAGEGKPSAEQKEAHKKAVKAKAGYEDDYLNKEENKKDKQKKEKKEKKPKGDYDELTGLDKQKAKKAEQERKELGKGSETGQEGREESKKWWKFWE